MASIGVERERSNESIIACRLLSYELLLPLRSCPPSVFRGWRPTPPLRCRLCRKRRKNRRPAGRFSLRRLLSVPSLSYMAFRESCGQHKISAFTLPVHDTVACGACQGESPATVGGEKLARPGHEKRLSPSSCCCCINSRSVIQSSSVL